MSLNTNNSNQDSVISVKAMDIITAFLFMVFGLVVMVESLKLGAHWGSDGPEAGYFPFYISLIILLSSAINLYQVAIVNKKKQTESFVDKESFKQVMVVLLPAIIFVLGVQLIGIYVSSIVYIAFFMVWLGKYPIWKALVVSVWVSVSLYLMFEFWFQIPLPHGSWFNPLEFVGVQ